MDRTHERDIDLKLPEDSLVCTLKIFTSEIPPLTQFTANHALNLFAFLPTLNTCTGKTRRHIEINAP